MKSILILTLLCILSTSVLSQDSEYDKGLEAFNSKEFSESLKIMQPYADKGDLKAQFIVGYCYSSKEVGMKNDSIAEIYLLKASEQGYGRAMGMLSVLYFGKSIKDEKYKIDALVWAEIAAAYDPIQRGTSTRYVIKKYMSSDELGETEKILREKKKKFDRINIQEFIDSNLDDVIIEERIPEKSKIPENKLGLIENPYFNWVYRWKNRKFECDSMYYTKSIEPYIIDSAIENLNKSNEFELSHIYYGEIKDNLILTDDEKNFLVNELKKLKSHNWEDRLFPYSRRLDHNEIQPIFDQFESEETEDKKNMCSIVYTFSKPIYFRDKTLVLYLDQKRYRTNYTQLNFSIYHFERGRWVELVMLFKYYEESN